ncbi:hypothetical protein HELRODRAFT_111080 [Helobdella robusta]|uniref:Uncharacterized protein n=1 Tax=Helobdella robusta TaxID=6412 RepID=T1EF78_HELRO|nr:hypothetical protein HELRODRAFT_111080 [Helobdella robusta]ESO05532.1 hypothetical protein HELRODRAFT_111080 [Helobdella robusta]
MDKQNNNNNNKENHYQYQSITNNNTNNNINNNDNSSNNNNNNNNNIELSNDVAIRPANVEPHCHTWVELNEPLTQRFAVRQLVKASILCLVFIIAEVAGGIIANSLAIATDAAHLLGDLTSFVIGICALLLAARAPTKRMSFGWYRAEIMGAMLSILIIWLVTVILCYMAVMRIVNNNYVINSLVMMITGGLAVLFNLCMIFVLGHGHSHSHNPPSSPNNHSLASSTAMHSAEQPDAASTSNADVESGRSSGQSEKMKLVQKKQSDINVRAAFIHVIGDLVQSVGVFLAAVIIYFKPEWKIADPICTFIFSVLVLITTGKILKDLMQVLMEAVPTNVPFNQVKEQLRAITGVKEIHNLRIWSLTTTKVALSAHVALENLQQSQQVITQANQMLKDKFNIYESTIQVENYVNGMDDCNKCKEPKD